MRSQSGRTLAILFGTCLSGMLQAGTSNGLMDLSTDGRLIACANRDSGTVSIIDRETLEMQAEIPVGRHPEGVTFLGNSHRLAVAVYGDDNIRILDADKGSIQHSVDVFDEPYGLVSSNDGQQLWATLDFPGRVIEVDTKTLRVRESERLGEHLRGIALTRDGRLLVTEYKTGILKAVDASTFQVVDEWIGSPQDNLARQIVIHPSRAKAYLPHQRSITDVAHGSGSIFPYVSIVDLDKTDGKRRKRIQMDSFRGTYVVANPWAAAVSPQGDRFYIAFSGTDDMFVCKVLDDDYFELEYEAVLRTGSNPRGVRVSPDGKAFYVYAALDMRIDEYSARTLEKTRSVTVCDWPGSEEELVGKRLFYTANPPMTSRRWISCSSCHPDGDDDGRTWQQPEGLRNTQSMFGLKQTHPIHWSADRDEVQDFEHTIRSALMQGRGLIRGKVNDSLAAPNAGRSDLLDALAAYTNSHQFDPSPYARSGLSAAAKRGRELFFSQAAGCAECHSGTYCTDRKMHDVGTGQSDSSELLGPDYDTPTLLGVYRSAPYLHHGKAATLEEVLTTFNPDDRHGKTSHLSADEISDLVSYLKMLPLDRLPATDSAK